MDKEIWKDIAGYEGLYQVSNFGRIKSLYWSSGTRHKKREKIMKDYDNGKGYRYITLRKEGKYKNFYIHRLVAETFIPNLYNKNEVNHLDFDKNNNYVENLEWCDRETNTGHYYDNKLKTITGEKYITYRSSRNKFRFVYKGKEYKGTNTLEESLKIRKEVLGF